MLASFVDRYGSPECIRFGEAPLPVPKAGQVRVRVRAVAVTAGDARIRAGRFPRGFGLPARLAIEFRGPRARTLGNSVAGVVDAVGEGVTEYAVGDEVAAMTGARMGGHAQYCLAPVKSVARKPAALSFTDAAGLLFGGSTAVHFVTQRAQVMKGESVLVIGAPGSVGTSAVQFARRAGATVTAVASAPNHDLVRRLGADRAIDYTATPVDTLTERFDVVIDTVGTLNRKSGRRLLAEHGRLCLVAANLADTIGARGNVKAGPAPERAENLARVLSLAAEGHLDPVTTVLGGLEALPAAHALVDSGHKVGNLVIEP